MTEGFQRIRLTLAYEGTDFCGWQRQPRDPSVQETLEGVLSRIHGQAVTVTASGRTDSGVHAQGQVVHFDAPPISLPPERYPLACNSLLPPSVRVLSAGAAAPDFHARYQAVCRVYRYRLAFGPAPLPEEARWCWHRRRRPELRRLNALCRPLLGTHDFTTFTAAGDPSESKVRRIYSAAFFPRGSEIIFEIGGNAFLWRMVRSLTGTILELEEKGGLLEQLAPAMARRLEAQERGLAGTSAPARGLSLHRVFYKGEPNGYFW